MKESNIKGRFFILIASVVVSLLLPTREARAAAVGKLSEKSPTTSIRTNRNCRTGFGRVALQLNPLTVSWYDRVAQDASGTEILVRLAEASGVYDRQTGCCADLDRANDTLRSLTPDLFPLLRRLKRNSLSAFDRSELMDQIRDFIRVNRVIVNGSDLSATHQSRALQLTGFLGSNWVLDIGFGFGRVEDRLIEVFGDQLEIYVVEKSDNTYDRALLYALEHPNVRAISGDFLKMRKFYESKFGLIYWLWNGPAEFSASETEDFFAKAKKVLASPGILVTDFAVPAFESPAAFDEDTFTEVRIRYGASTSDETLVLRKPTVGPIFESAAAAGLTYFYGESYQSDQKGELEREQSFFIKL